MYKVPQLSIRKSALAKTQSQYVPNNVKSYSPKKGGDKLEARYDLFLTPDWGIGKKQNKDGEYTKVGMTKHTQWFYFSTK